MRYVVFNGLKSVVVRRRKNLPQARDLFHLKTRVGGLEVSTYLMHDFERYSLVVVSSSCCGSLCLLRIVRQKQLRSLVAGWSVGGGVPSPFSLSRLTAPRAQSTQPTLYYDSTVLIKIGISVLDILSIL